MWEEDHQSAASDHYRWARFNLESCAEEESGGFAGNVIGKG